MPRLLQHFIFIYKVHNGKLTLASLSTWRMAHWKEVSLMFASEMWAQNQKKTGEEEEQMWFNNLYAL